MDEIIDVSSVWNTRIKTTDQHQSRAKDIANIKRELAMRGQKECFMICRRYFNQERKL